MVNSEAIEKFQEVIEPLASSLGVAAEHVYGVLVRQAITDGAVGVFMEWYC